MFSVSRAKRRLVTEIPVVIRVKFLPATRIPCIMKTVASQRLSRHSIALGRQYSVNLINKDNVQSEITPAWQKSRLIENDSRHCLTGGDVVIRLMPMYSRRRKRIYHPYSWYHSHGSGSDWRQQTVSCYTAAFCYGYVQQIAGWQFTIGFKLIMSRNLQENSPAAEPAAMYTDTVHRFSSGTGESVSAVRTGIYKADKDELSFHV